MGAWGGGDGDVILNRCDPEQGTESRAREGRGLDGSDLVLEEVCRLQDGAAVIWLGILGGW